MTERAATAALSVPQSPHLTESLGRARLIAREQIARHVTLEHLLLSFLTDPETAPVLAAAGIDLARLETDLHVHLEALPDRLLPGETGEPGWHPDLLRMLEYSMAAAAQSGRPTITGAIVLAALIGEGKTAAAQLLQAQGLTFEAAIGAMRATPAPTRGATGDTASRALLPPSTPYPEPPPVAARAEAPRVEGSGAGGGGSADRRMPEPRPARGPPRGEPERAPPSGAGRSAEGAPPRAAARGPAGPPGPPPAWDAGGPPPPGQTDRGHSAPRPQPRAPAPEHGPGVAPPRAPAAREYPDDAYRHGGSAPRGEPAAPVSRPEPGYGAPAGRGPYPHPPPGSEPPRTQRMPEPAGRGAPNLRAEQVSPAEPQLPATIAPGELVENIPRRMRVGVTEIVEVRVARERIEGIEVGLQGRGLPYRHDLYVTKAMVVRLKSPDGAFWVEPGSPETQWVENSLGLQPGEFARWRFSVTPRRRGAGRLQLVVSARTVGSDGLTAEAALPDQMIDVKVRTNYARLARAFGGWTVAMLVGGALGKFGERALEFASAFARKLGGP